MCEDSLTAVPAAARDLVGEGWGFGLGFAVLNSPAQAGDFAAQGSCRWAGIFGTEYFFDPASELLCVMFGQRYPWEPFDVRSTYRQLIYGALEEKPV